MSIVIQGQNTSNNGDAEYLFEPTNQQINNLNTLCYGRMDTPIKNVQFNFLCEQDLFKGCYIDLQYFDFYRYGVDQQKVLISEEPIRRITFDEAFSTLSDFCNYIQQESVYQYRIGDFTFEQGLTFDQNLLQKGICSFCFYAQCITSTHANFPVDRINMDSNFSYDEIGVEYPKVMTIYGDSLLKILGIQTIPKDFKKYALPYFDPRLNKEIEPLIRLTYSDGSTSIQNGPQDLKNIVQYDFYFCAKNIQQNLLCMCPTWATYSDTYYVSEQEITRQNVTYTVPYHYDWRKCFYRGGIKYNPAQWINRQTNVAIDVNTEFATELDKFYFYTDEPYTLQIYNYLLFDSPQLAYANYADAQGGVYNIIAKTVNNTNPNQYFTMTTTEPLKKLTLQNLANLKIYLKIYDERFSLLKAFQQPLLIITMDRQKQDEKELKDLRKTVDGSNVNVLIV